MLPSHVIPSWAWRAVANGWATARGELRVAMECVMEDLEGLGAVARAGCTDGSVTRDTLGAAVDDACDEESLRVDDLAPPPSQRAAYEQEAPQPTARSEDFELIDRSVLEEEAQSWVMVAHANETWTG